MYQENIHFQSLELYMYHGYYFHVEFTKSVNVYYFHIESAKSVKTYISNRFEQAVIE